MKTLNSLLEQALRYYDEYGFCVIPIGFDKKPPKGFKWQKYQKTRPTESELREWFSNGKLNITGLAVVCGKVSGGLTILDFDSMDLYEQWRKRYPDLAEKLPTDKTSRGRHVYFRSNLGKSHRYGKIDVISEKKYALLPPSSHPKGGNYEWIIPLPENELPLLNPREWRLHEFTEETEDTEDLQETEDSEDIGHRSHCGGVLLLDNFSKEIKREVERAIQHTLPKAEGQRNDAVLPLCQWLKGIPELRDLEAKELKPIVREWHRIAYPVIGTKPFDNTWGDFVHTWKRVKWPKGDVMVQHAVRRAVEGKTVLPEAEEYDTQEAQLLLKVCYELQQAVGDKPFFIDCRTAGGIVGLRHDKAFKVLEMFVEDEKLQLVEKHTTRRATRYRYIGN